MEYSEILDILRAASAHDLYRLHAELERLLDDPNRVFRIKKAIHPGDIIEYYDIAAACEVKARILSFQRSRLVVENLHNQKKFTIPYIAINTSTLPAADTKAGNGVERAQLQLGQILAFCDADGRQRSGEVIELGAQSATLETDEGIWRVNYSQLSMHADTNALAQKSS